MWLQSAAACGGMPWNGKEEKIMGTGCNHHEMMVATEKRNPVNIIFYLSKVISLMFLVSVRTLRSPRIRKIYTRPPEKKNNEKPEHRNTPPSPSLSSFITSGSGGGAARGVDASGWGGDPALFGPSDGLGLGVHGRSGELGLGLSGRL